MISLNKINSEKQKLISGCKKCNGVGCSSCFKNCSFIDLMAEAEIPVDYWFRNFNDFYGDKEFKEIIQKYINNLNYDNGSLCLVGRRGTGKTFSACTILKKALTLNYKAYYTTMVDIVSNLVSYESYNFRKLLKEIDFLVVDEIDPRFFMSQGSHDLYGNHFENVLRTRTQNKLPLIICTNSEDVGQIFGGEFQLSFESLCSQFIKIVQVRGKDARKDKEKI